MTKIILEGQDALNYIEMLNRIKELESIASNQPAPYEHRTPSPAIDTLSDAIDEAQPKIETKNKDVPSDFKHPTPFDETSIKETPSTEHEQNWKDLVDAGVPNPQQKNKKWQPYEDLAITTAVNQPDPKYFSVTVLANFLGRTPSSIRSKVVSMGYSNKRGMIKS